MVTTNHIKSPQFCGSFTWHFGSTYNIFVGLLWATATLSHKYYKFEPFNLSNVFLSMVNGQLWGKRAVWNSQFWEPSMPENYMHSGGPHGVSDTHCTHNYSNLCFSIRIDTVVIWSATQVMQNIFEGTASRIAQIHSIWGDAMVAEESYMNLGDVCQSLEWCTNRKMCTKVISSSKRALFIIKYIMTIHDFKNWPRRRLQMRQEANVVEGEV